VEVSIVSASVLGRGEVLERGGNASHTKTRYL